MSIDIKYMVGLTSLQIKILYIIYVIKFKCDTISLTLVDTSKDGASSHTH